MKRVSIKITVPKKVNPWKVSIAASHGKHYENAATAYNKIEHYLLGLPVREPKEILVKVDYSSQHPSSEIGWINDGEYASGNDALYALACFPEDFISVNLAKEKYKKYQSHTVRG